MTEEELGPPPNYFDPLDPEEDVREAAERCVGLALNVTGFETTTYARMRSRTVRTEEDFEGLPVEEPPGYAKP